MDEARLERLLAIGPQLAGEPRCAEHRRHPRDLVAVCVRARTNITAEYTDDSPELDEKASLLPRFAQRGIRRRFVGLDHPAGCRPVVPLGMTDEQYALLRIEHQHADCRNLEHRRADTFAQSADVVGHRHRNSPLGSWMSGRDSRLFHADAVGVTHWNACRIEIFETEHVDAEMVGRHALAMKRIDAARPAEKMSRRSRMESIFGQRVFACDQLETILVHFHHQRVLAATDRAVAGGQLGKIGLDLEAHGAAMAAATQVLEWPRPNGRGMRRDWLLVAHRDNAASAARYAPSVSPGALMVTSRSRNRPSFNP